MQPIFITGIGTGVGKTLVSAIVAEALQADYWKPVQAGFSEGTDSEWVRSMIGDNLVVHPEVYKLKLPASPHIAAREEGIKIDLQKICDQQPATSRQLVIEGAGGLLVPLNENEFVIDLIKQLNAKVILVSRNYLGSINHSLLTAQVCKVNNIKVPGWIFNDNYLNYEKEISEWTGFPVIGRISFSENIDKEFIRQQAFLIQGPLRETLLEQRLL
ncbi:MAG TPA: dethiobiotin synthase [Chitinophagaceae bacterium]|nr:dethiobiotin synthase [Chitinophagaceae bacterium]